LTNSNQKNKSPVTSKALSITKLTGTLCLIGATAIAIFFHCLSGSQYFIVYTLIGLGLALLLMKSAAKSSLSYKAWNVSIGLSGGVVLPFILYFFNPIDSFKSSACDLPISVTVFVHGKKGRQDLILRQQGYVIMDINGERKKESINEKGQACFQNLHLGDKVLLNIDFSEPYRAIYPDSAHLITADERIYLPVGLQGTNSIHGMVLYNDQPLPDVKIKINTLVGSSDSTGTFSIIIPDSLESKQYNIWFIKKGFKARSVTAFPQTGQPLNIIMEK
jgi:hypothetical protein